MSDPDFKNTGWELVMTETTARRRDWLEERRTGLGGSEAGTILGVNPWGSIWDIYASKTGQIPLEDEDDFESDPMKWGARLEETVGNAFVDDVEIEEADEFDIVWPDALWRDGEFEFMLGTPDAFLHEPSAEEPIWQQDPLALLEIKTSSKRMAHLWDNKVPPWVYLQVQQYLQVLDMDVSYVCVLIGKDDFRHYRLEYDEETVRTLINELGEFWVKVQMEEEPKLDGSAAAADWLAKKYDAQEGDTKRVGTDQAQWFIEAHDELSDRLKRIKEQRREVKNHLKDIMGSATRMEVVMDSDEERTVIWQPRTRTSLDKDQVIRAFPEVEDDENFWNETSYRHFQVY